MPSTCESPGTHPLPEHPTTSQPKPCIPKKPNQPSLSFTFPKRTEGKQLRSCQAKWFPTFKWLHYDNGLDAVFCHMCMVQNSMGRLSLAHRKEYAFIGTGFTNWKKALEKFREHEASECHSVALTYQEIQPKCKDIVTTFDECTKETMKMNRKCFVKIIESLLYLGRQGIALRQSNDLESNFVQLLELRAIDIPELRKWLDQPGRSDTYTSHDSQNEILSLAANSIVRDIVLDIKSGCSWFALIADEYTDIANKEQLSICVRWIDNKLESHEDFLGFYEIPDIKSQTIDFEGCSHPSSTVT